MARDDEQVVGDASYAYPPELTDLVLRHWGEVESVYAGGMPRPSRERLALALAACYHASLLREEGRPVTFRLVLAGPDFFDVHAGPPSGVHRLVFDAARPLDQHELRRLSPAAAFSRSFIGAVLDGRTGPAIWGLIHSGPDWLESVRGGRESIQAIPAVPTIAVTGPGRVVVDAGPVFLGELSNGTLRGGRLDAFNASWVYQVFVQSWVSRPGVSPGFGPTLSRQVVRRIIAGVRAAHHGGMVLIVPHRRIPVLVGESGMVRIKYGFIDEEPRQRLLTLSTRIVDQLAALQAALPAGAALPGWDDYAQSESPAVKALDAALYEVAHFVADLSQVDGAVILSDRLELIGFGAEIAGDLPEVERVARAADLEGRERTWMRTDRVGTRHRSAYRLCQAARDVLALVVSQDGGLRFVRWHDQAVTYWDQVATAPWEA
jgi:hypothetical protein